MWEISRLIIFAECISTKDVFTIFSGIGKNARKGFEVLVIILIAGIYLILFSAVRVSAMRKKDVYRHCKKQREVYSGYE